jgi:hypothetical protein
MEDKFISMDDYDFQIADDYISHVLSIVRSDLDIDAIDTIKHYLDHDEYEMSFECLFTEIINLTTIPSIDFSKAMEMGRLLKLNEESVFDTTFWIKFERYILNVRTD